MEVFKKALLDAVLEEYKELENHKTASQACGLGANNSLWIDTEHQRLCLTMAENCVQCYFRSTQQRNVFLRLLQDRGYKLIQHE